MSSNDRLPRTILPKANARNVHSSDLASDDNSNQPDGVSPRHARNAPQVRSNIRSACLACRQRRSKCTGGTPCSRCQTLGTDCLYEEGQDRRTRAIREKGKEELELHKKVLEGLFRAIRTGGDRALMGLVKENASIEALAAAIDGDLVDGHVDGDTTDPNLDSSASHDPNSPISGQIDPRAFGDYLSRRRSTLFPARMDPGMVDGEYNMMDPLLPMDSKGGWLLPAAQIEPLEFNNPQDMHTRHMLAPLHNPAAVMLDPVSKFYIQFRETVRHMAQRGIPQENVLGDDNVQCGLIFQTHQSTNTYNVYTWASAVVNMFPELDIYFRLSWLVMMVRFMRWSVDMTEDNFRRMHDLMKPTSMQVSIPHAPFIDLAPLPQLRDVLIEKSRDYCSAIQLSGISVSWNRPLEEAVVHDTLTGRMTVSKAFEDHVSDANNFVFGKAFFSVFPDLQGKVRVTSDDFIPATTLVSFPDNTVPVTTRNT